MKIALCNDNPFFNENKLNNKKWCEKFPGSGWAACFYELGEKYNIEIASGDIAESLIRNGIWTAKDVLVVNDMNSKNAAQLINLGAKPFLIYCFESSIYAPFYYDQINNIAKKYLYNWDFDLKLNPMYLASSGKCLPLKFPSFFLSDIKNIEDWNGRKFMVLVAENKYKTSKLFIPASLNLKDFIRQLKYFAIQIISPSYRRAIRLCLHDKRLEFIEYFLNQKLLDIFGSGWGNINNLPRSWVRKLLPLIDINYFGRCDDKLKTLASYRFSICYENMRTAGYMTEKIIDCFVAGTIPIYYGDPRIHIELPENSFIDPAKFDSFEKLNDYLHSIDQNQAINMISAGRLYLQSHEGRKHSYEGFANNIMELATICQVSH